MMLRKLSIVLSGVIIVAVCAAGCKKRAESSSSEGKKRDSLPTSSVTWLQPVDDTQVITTRYDGTRKITALEHVDRGVIWKRAGYPVVGSTVGDGVVTLRYHEPGINVPSVEYGVMALSLSTGKELWHYRAPQKIYRSSLFEIGFSRHAGHQLFERFNTVNSHAVIVALDRRNGKLQWTYTLPFAKVDPWILHIDKELLIVGVAKRGWLVLSRASGKKRFFWPVWNSEFAGHCLLGGGLIFAQKDGLHRFEIATASDKLVSPSFWTEGTPRKPTRILACGSYQKQPVLVLEEMPVHAVSPYARRFVVVGLNAASKIAWRIPLGQWEPRTDLGRYWRSSGPFIGEQSRFVPFRARFRGNVKGDHRMMVVDLKLRSVVASGKIRQSLYGWQWDGLWQKRYLFSRFNTLALFDGTTGRVISGLNCPGKGLSVGQSAAQTIWICGSTSGAGRLSARHLATFKAISGRHNTLLVGDVTSKLTTLFGLTYR